jgi:hypothetical protein
VNDAVRPENALVSLSKANDVIRVAEPDHTDGAISATVGKQWQGMAANNTKHLFLEHDPKDVTVAQLAGEDSEYGRMIRTAMDNGAQVHLYDDRSRQRERDARYPEESALRHQQDTYLKDPIGLMVNAENPTRMAAYLQEIDANRDADLAFRNERMAENIDRTMREHPGEKAAAMVGAAHTDTTHDLDEMLRARGHQTVTAELNSPNTNNDNLVRRLSSQDKPDVVISAETGDALSYKAPGTNVMQTTRGKSDADIPWRNDEPVAAPVTPANGMEEFLANPKFNAEEHKDLGFIGTLIEVVFEMRGPDPDRLMKARVMTTEFAAYSEVMTTLKGFANPVELAEFTSVQARRADTTIRTRVEELMTELGNGSPDPLIAARQERHLRGQIEALGALSERLNAASAQAFKDAEQYLRGETEAVMNGFALASSVADRSDERRALSGMRHSAAEIGQWSKRLENAKAGRTEMHAPAEDAPDITHLPSPSTFRLPKQEAEKKQDSRKKLVEDVDCSWANGFVLKDCVPEKQGVPEASPSALPPSPGQPKDSGRAR